MADFTTTKMWLKKLQSKVLFRGFFCYYCVFGPYLAQMVCFIIQKLLLHEMYCNIRNLISNGLVGGVLLLSVQLQLFCQIFLRPAIYVKLIFISVHGKKVFLFQLKLFPGCKYEA